MREHGQVQTDTLCVVVVMTEIINRTKSLMDIVNFSSISGMDSFSEFAYRGAFSPWCPLLNVCTYWVFLWGVWQWQSVGVSALPLSTESHLLLGCGCEDKWATKAVPNTGPVITEITNAELTSMGWYGGPASKRIIWCYQVFGCITTEHCGCNFIFDRQVSEQCPQ